MPEQAGSNEAIFGSVTAADVVEAIRMQTGRELKKSDITLPEIKVGGRVGRRDAEWYVWEVGLGWGGC